MYISIPCQLSRVGQVVGAGCAGQQQGMGWRPLVTEQMNVQPGDDNSEVTASDEQSLPDTEEVEHEQDAPVAESEAGEESGAGATEQAEPAPPKLSPDQMLIMQLRATVIEREDKLKNYITAYKQAMADIDREKERLARERQKVLDRERMDMCLQLLEVLDNLDRCRAGCADASTTAEIAGGLEMVSGQFLTTLEGLGVVRMKCLGEDFDHNLHEASGVIPAQEDQRDQEILFVERAGYIFGEQLLRAARVVVAARES